MIKKIIAILLIAGIGINAKVGVVIAMDETDGYAFWEYYEPDIDEEHFVENDIVDDGVDLPIVETQIGDKENSTNIDSIVLPEEPITPSEPDPIYLELTNEIDEQNSFDNKIEDIYYNGSNQDFDFSDFSFNYNPYNQGSFDFFTPEVVDLESSDIENEKSETEESNKTIQYFYGEKVKNAKYIDTGIKVNKDGKIDYEFIVGLFERIAIEKELKLVKDNSKLMLLLEGKIITITSDNSNESALIDAFSGTSINLKIQDTRKGGKYSIADYLELMGKINVKINGEDITLHAEPEIINSRAILPIRSIGEGLGGLVEWDNEDRVATVTKGDVKLVYTVDSGVVEVNKEKYMISEKTKIAVPEDRLLSVINLLVTELNASMHWDSIENILVIENNEPDPKVNLDANF